MTTINHALWGATFGRLIGMPIQGVIAGITPDIFSLPILAKYHFQGKKKSNQVPKWAYNWYSFLHNWLFSGIIILALFLIKHKLWILGLAYFWHIAEDAFVHTDYATQFLYPIWKGKIQIYSASDHKWIQVVDILLIIVVNLLISAYNIRVF